MRFRREDANAIAEIEDVVSCHRDGGPSVLEVAMPAIGRLIGSEDKWTAYTIDARGERLQIARMYAPFFEVERAKREINALIAAKPVGWASYDPFRPEPADQDVAVDIVRRIGWERLEQVPNVSVLAKHGLSGHSQLRVLLCDGGSLLAFIGGWRPGEVYTHRERRLLQAIVPALRRALLVERRLHTGPHHEALLEAALEALPTALVVSPTGAVLHANAAGRRLLASGEVPELAALARGCVPGWEVTRVKSAGAPDALLAVRRGEPHRAELVARAARRYALTPRQAEVLELLADGLTYEAMSVRLGCAVKTVEVHVSAVLEKLDASSRADAIARLW